MSEHDTSISISSTAVNTQFLAELSDQDFWDYASSVANSVPVSSKQQPGEFLVCELVYGRCFLPLTALREIVSPMPPCMRLPASPPWMMGIVAWRGETIAVIDLAAYLENRATQYLSDKMLVIAYFNDLTFGLCVSAIGSIIIVDEEKLALDEQTISKYALLPRGVIRGAYEDGLVLNVDMFLADLVRCIGTVSSHE